MPQPLEAVVVITGASSGIGRAAALRLAHRARALALCGRIDVWVNNAGTIAYGPFEEIPSEVSAGSSRRT